MMTTQGIHPGIQVSPLNRIPTQSEGQGERPSSSINPLNIWYLFFARDKGFEEEYERAWMCVCVRTEKGI